METQVEQQTNFFVGNVVTLKPHVKFENMTAGKGYNIWKKEETVEGVWYSVNDDTDTTQVLFADQIQALR